MEILGIILSAISIVISIILLIIVIKNGKPSGGGDNSKELEVIKDRLSTLSADQKGGQTELRREVSDNIKGLSQMLSDSQRQSADNMNQRLELLEHRLQGIEKNNVEALSKVNETVNKQLLEIREDNGKRLDQIRTTVDEKLQKTLDERMAQSFKTVSERLEEVHKGLGEMQSLAAGVGDLKKILSNVKTRGIMGETQLEGILSEILAPEQYEKDVVTVPDSKNHVEFAIKLPGDGDGTIYLPIDAKFPGDTYHALRDAYDSGDKDTVDAAKKVLSERIRNSAKDIREKYIQPPHTTGFGIMFLPFTPRW